MAGAWRRRGVSARSALIAAAWLGLLVVLASCRSISVLPSPQPSLAPDKFSHDFPDMERALPPTLAGVPAQSVESFDGEAAVDDEGLYFGMYPIISETVGFDHVDRIRIAGEAWPMGGGWLTLRLFRVDDPKAVWPAVTKAALEASADSSNRWHRVTVGGREVLSALDLPPESQAIYVMIIGDTLYEIDSPDHDKAAAIVAGLP